MPDCGDITTCDTANLSLDDLLRKLIQTDENGCPAIKVKVIVCEA